MIKLKVGDFVKLKKVKDLGVPNQPKKGDIGIIKKNRGFLFDVEFKDRAAAPKSNGWWSINKAHLEWACEQCGKPVCPAVLREEGE